MTKLMSFEYTDAKGKTSTKEVIELSKASPLMLGIDVTELDEDARIEMAVKIKEVKDKYIEQVAAIAQSYDIKYNLRQYKPENMTNVESTEID